MPFVEGGGGGLASKFPMLQKLPSLSGQKTKTPEQLVKKAKECIKALGPPPSLDGEPWMAYRETDASPMPLPSPKASLSQSQAGLAPLDGSASSVASTASNTSSLALDTSLCGPSPRNADVKISSWVFTPRAASSKVFTFQEPPTPTNGAGIKRTNSTVAQSMEKSGPSGSPKAKPSAEEEAQRRLVKCMRRMRDMLYGDGKAEPCVKQSKLLAQELIKADIIPLLLQHFPSLPFEARKDTVRVFSDLAFHNWSGFSDPYLSSRRFDVVEQLVLGYTNANVAAKCGTMLRDALRNERVARRFLMSGQVWPFFDTYVHLRNFEVASDAFATLKMLLLGHKKVVPEFLDRDYEKVFPAFRRMLQSSNYVTKRQSLRLLEDILIDRHNFQIMKRFVRCVDNLKAIMMLLRESRSPITQYEAFCIFRIFVVNPHVPHVIARIFVNNREKLEAYITKLGRPRRGDDEEEDEKAFEEEKELLIERLKELEAQERHHYDQD